MPSYHWSSSSWGLRAKTKDNLMLAIGRIGAHRSASRVVWRGVANANWSFQSSLNRHLKQKGYPPTEQNTRSFELEIISTARSWGIGVSSTGLATDLELLSVLQHHGIPTRLIDVTSNPMTALWFACEKHTLTITDGDSREVSGALLAFDVSRLTIVPTLELDGPKDLKFLAAPHAWGLDRLLSTSKETKSPCVVEPTLRDARMTAQEGLFLASVVPEENEIPGIEGVYIPPGDAPTEEQFQSIFRAGSAGRPFYIPFCAILISPALKRSMRAHLASSYNRTHRSLFPDLGGMVTAFQSDQLDLLSACDDLAQGSISAS